MYSCGHMIPEVDQSWVIETEQKLAACASLVTGSIDAIRGRDEVLLAHGTVTAKLDHFRH